MDGLYWKTLLKWMIWGYHYFRKPTRYIMIFRICPWILSFFLQPKSPPGQVALPVALLEAVPAGPILLGFGHGSWLGMQLRRVLADGGWIFPGFRKIGSSTLWRIPLTKNFFN